MLGGEAHWVGERSVVERSVTRGAFCKRRRGNCGAGGIRKGEMLSVSSDKHGVEGPASPEEPRVPYSNVNWAVERSVAGGAFCKWSVL